MKWKKKDKKVFIDLVTKWKRVLGIGDWTINVEFCDFDNADNELTTAKIDSASRYKSAWLCLYPRILEPQVDKSDTILHELCHTVVAPLVELITSAINGCLVQSEAKEYFHEYVTSHIERIVSSLKN